MAVAKDACGLEAAAGNGRRLHLGIPEAVFVVRDPVPWRLGPRLKITFQSPHRSALLGEGRWRAELRGPGTECHALSVPPYILVFQTLPGAGFEEWPEEGVGEDCGARPGC